MPREMGLSLNIEERKRQAKVGRKVAKMGSSVSKPRCGRETQGTEIHGGADRMDECERAGLAHRTLPSPTLPLQLKKNRILSPLVTALQIRGFLAEGKKCSRLSLGPTASSQIMTWRLIINYECSPLSYACPTRAYFKTEINLFLVFYILPSLFTFPSFCMSYSLTD